MEASATSRALGITELLELVLLELPQRDLYQAQRICKGWKTVISNSSPIQEVMWLSPASPSSPPAKYEKTETLLDYPLVIKYLSTSHLNPLFHGRYDPDPSLSGPTWKVEPGNNDDDGDIIHVESLNKILPFLPTTDYGASNVNCKATWEQMQVASPPCKAIQIARIWEAPLVLRDETGVRMGQLVRVIASLERAHRAAEAAARARADARAEEERIAAQSTTVLPYLIYSDLTLFHSLLPNSLSSPHHAPTNPPILHFALLSLPEALLFLFIATSGLSLSIALSKLSGTAALDLLRDTNSLTRYDTGNAFIAWNLGYLSERNLFAWQKGVYNW
ncbi:uncharacterized protein BDZ99DRAFT_515920 [Mytilinidion resinicola]|uniref:F-box domain-containing protein n=1 Tax=Mytilinidion resinicola TaxID=574789 RepID=A0A6A6Z4G3_9PEZI|nr:uncharacterized protein BDZ99DRAFT_515920 [Mytilinidion resinicola]KAF2815174.1 hypothetical protein BDZ99DRAFT_515920 [Mytilinidion resinicola]